MAITHRPLTNRLTGIGKLRSIYFKCQTSLVNTFKELYKDQFRYEGNRAILFNINDKIPVGELNHCIAMALIYHLSKKPKKKQRQKKT